jgi:hypothetical protein
MEGKKKKSASLNAAPLMKGTTLVRQWQGVTHTVTVLEDGFEYLGQRFKSLSVIARKITGTHWGGPAFFGLRSYRKKQEKDSTPLAPQEIRE